MHVAVTAVRLEGGAGARGALEARRARGRVRPPRSAALPNVPELPVLFDAVPRAAPVTFAYRGERAPPRSVGDRVPPRALVRRRARPRPRRRAGLPHRPHRGAGRDGRSRARSSRPPAIDPRDLLRDDPLALRRRRSRSTASVLVDAPQAAAVVAPGRRARGRRAPRRRLGGGGAPGDQRRRVPLVRRRICSTVPRCSTPPELRADVVDWLERMATVH